MTRPNRTRWIARGAALAAALSLPAAAATDTTVFGDPARGRALFETKQCVRCHAVWGHGGKVGPDIVRAVAGKSVPELAGAFWNHTPRMISEMQTQGHPWPSLERDEMGDLLSYLYYLRLFDAPGDAVQGAISFGRLGCSACHDVGGDQGAIGGSLDRFSRYASSVPLAQAMWNAAPRMQATQLGRGRPIPTFTGTEVADIQAYLREEGSRGGERTVLLPLPDPHRGQKLFRSKGCAKCHEGAGAVIDLADAALHRSVSEIAGVLWNHSYAMRDRMRESGIPFPRFSGNEMADVISYVYFKGFLGQHGDPKRGGRVFRDRGCAGCHTGEDAIGPDLGRAPVDDPVALASAMWNHAPEMHELMGQQGVPWPKFEEGEMEDLVSYLQALQRRRRASVGR
ncbi:MAG: hypothetical protein D6718_09665 [Acidobacteria bacterium]|nr:MAG: hypothetical protein D6718_09665 [Acidobacteriota bacterium]